MSPSNDNWRRHVLDPAIAGRSIQINGRGIVVAGVMPDGFKLPTDFGEDAAAFFLTSLIVTQLHDIAPRDLTTFTGVPLIMTVVAVGASYLPALRATRVDPLIALRAE